MPVSTLTAHRDLDQLRAKRIRVPELFRSGSWLSAPLGHDTEAGLGPSGAQLLLWLPVRAQGAGADSGAGEGDDSAPSWSEVEGALGAAGAESSRTVSADALTALIGQRVDFKRTADGPRYVLRGREYPSDAFGNIFWKHGWALASASGLLVSLVNA